MLYMGIKIKNWQLAVGSFLSIFLTGFIYLANMGCSQSTTPVQQNSEAALAAPHHTPSNEPHATHLEMAEQSVLTLNNGLKMPQLGLGTYESKPGEVTEAVKTAIGYGYRHIDCAALYGNEPEVGAGLKAKIEDGTVKREDMFITSKLWNTCHRRDLVAGAFQKSLDNLGLDYIDLYLIHWPTAFKDGAEEPFPTDEDGKVLYSDAGYMDAWEELEKLVDAGKIKSIGLSNFNSVQIQKVMDEGRIKPVNLQVELNPYLSQDKLLEFCKNNDITVTAYCPLGAANRPWVTPDDPVLLEDPKIKAIADRIGKTAAQVALRWVVQRGVITVPKSVTAGRIKSNFEVFDFSLTDDDMEVLNSFDGCIHRAYALDTMISDHPDYPYKGVEF